MRWRRAVEIQQRIPSQPPTHPGDCNWKPRCCGTHRETPPYPPLVTHRRSPRRHPNLTRSSFHALLAATLSPSRCRFNLVHVDGDNLRKSNPLFLIFLLFFPLRLEAPEGTMELAESLLLLQASIRRSE